jgi:hypothetical protein
MLKKAKQFFGFISITTTSYYAIHTYYRSYYKLSNFEVAANKLGFNAQQHEALLKKFQLAGYFKAENIWCDLNRIGKIKNIEKSFKDVYQVIQDSYADQDDPAKFNAKLMCKNLFNSRNIDVEDSMDLIVYMAQHAFNRKPGQERNELISLDWMVKYKSFYLEQAKILGLIDRKNPQRKEYDFAWIAGANRLIFLTRIIDFNFNLTNYNLKIPGGIMLLAGNRELWANLDGIHPKLHDELLNVFKLNENVDKISLLKDDFNLSLNEGKDYVLYLARKFNVNLNPEIPLIQYSTIEECPPGRFLNRLYPNYNSEENKLTETLMAKDLIETDLKSKFFVSYIDTKAFKNSRPTTATTARDATEECISLIMNDKSLNDKKEFIILFESNNPHIERQMLTSQQEADDVIKSKGLDKKGYKIIIEGVGCACQNEDVSSIHSEFGALVAEKWKLAISNENKKPKRNYKDLLYQSRDNSSYVGNVPNVSSQFNIIFYDYESSLFYSF